jgi:hypothetical protein
MNRGRMKEAARKRVTIPESTGKTRSFLSRARICQLAFTSPRLRPMLST